MVNVLFTTISISGADDSWNNAIEIVPSVDEHTFFLPAIAKQCWKLTKCWWQIQKEHCPIGLSIVLDSEPVWQVLLLSTSLKLLCTLQNSPFRRTLYYHKFFPGARHSEVMCSKSRHCSTEALFWFLFLLSSQTPRCCASYRGLKINRGNGSKFSSKLCPSIILPADCFVCLID